MIAISLKEGLEIVRATSTEAQFRAYASKMRNNPDLASEEHFLEDSASAEGVSLLEKERA